MFLLVGVGPGDIALEKSAPAGGLFIGLVVVLPVGVATERVMTDNGS